MSTLGRLVFLGAGAFGVPLLAQLADIADDLLVVAPPDRPAGRRLRNRASAVAAYSREHALTLATPARLKSDEGRAAIRDFRPDGLLLASFGEIVPHDLLQIAARPPLNVHPSLLPRHRGAAPVAATILAGDAEAGVTLLVMTDRTDAGPIVAQWRVPLDGREESQQLERQLADLAARHVPPALSAWADGSLSLTPQREEDATMIRPMTRADGAIEWAAAAVEIDRQVRALQPWPGAWTTLDGRRLHVRRARPGPGVAGPAPGVLVPGNPPRVVCGVGTLILETVQPGGRPVMAAEAWQRGLPRDHIRLGDSAPV